MWLHAAEATAQSNGGLLAAVITLAGIVVSGLVAVLVALINRGKATPEQSPVVPPSVVQDDPEVTVRERLRVLEFRADSKDQADEVRDRRLDQVERALDIDNPRWRHR